MDEMEALGKKIRHKPVIKPFETKIKYIKKARFVEKSYVIKRVQAVPLCP